MLEDIAAYGIIILVILVPVLIVKFGQKKKDEGGGPQ